MAAERIKNLLRKRWLWVAAPVALVSLAVIFIAQYRSLRTLEQTLPAYRRETMSQFLREVTYSVTELYAENAERVLAVPSSAVTFVKPGVVPGSADGSACLQAVAPVAEFFKRQEFAGAKRYFIAVVTERNVELSGEILFYDAARQSMVFDPKAPEMRAISVAMAPYFIYIRAGAMIMLSPNAVDRDPNTRLLVKPIVDREKKVVAIAGVVLEPKWFEQQAVPPAIHANLKKFFPTEYKDAIVVLQYGDFPNEPSASGSPPSRAGERIFSTDPSIKAFTPELKGRFEFGFRHYALGIAMRSENSAQWARRYFIFNLSLTIIGALSLLVTLVLGLRTATREMKLLQMKTDFVANVSHELRTPLASIRVFGEMLKLGRVKDQEKMREYGGYIETQGRRLTQVINNILDFSRIESGKKEYRFEPADARELIADAIEATKGRANQSGHVVRVSQPDKAVSAVSVDFESMSLALTNLLDNAMKYSGDTKEIELRLEQKDGFVRIAVTDHGIGIPREEQKKIFEKFYRVSTGLIHDVKGSGLGLSIVQHIVEAHDGKITVESDAGQGSTFTIHLPAQPERGASNEEKGSFVVPPSGGLPAGAGTAN